MKKTTRGKSATGSKRQKKTSNGAARVSGRDELSIGDQHRASPPDDPEQDPLRCPDCSGPLYKVSNGELIQWSCREGHTFSPDSLNASQTEALERALWVAVRTMKERALVDRTVSSRPDNQSSVSRERLAERAQATERDVELIREILGRL